MAPIDKLERALGRLAIPNLSLYLIMGQVFFVLGTMMKLIDPAKADFAAVDLLNGEWWRVITFMFVVPVPPPDRLMAFMFLAFGWYLFYLMGSALETHWGAFRFNLFLLVSYMLTVAFSFITPGYAVTNLFILGSVFIAFAYLNPDFELLLFFILPLKIKWLALLTVVLGAFRFVGGPLSIRLQTIAAVITFLLFFGGDMLRTLRQGGRARARQAQREATVAQARHVCHVCGKTDRSDPQFDFRYCSKCAGDQCYCPEHIQNHAHVVAADEKPAE